MKAGMTGHTPPGLVSKSNSRMDDDLPSWRFSDLPSLLFEEQKVPVSSGLPCLCKARGLPGGSDGQQSACNVGDLGSFSGLGRTRGGGHGNPLQYSFLESPTDRGAWQAIVHGVAKNWT